MIIIHFINQNHNTMKKILTALAAVLMIVGCTKETINQNENENEKGSQPLSAGFFFAKLCEIIQYFTNVCV